jgi:hypothetical protein
MTVQGCVNRFTAAQKNAGVDWLEDSPCRTCPDGASRAGGAPSERKATTYRPTGNTRVNAQGRTVVEYACVCGHTRWETARRLVMAQSCRRCTFGNRGALNRMTTKC